MKADNPFSLNGKSAVVAGASRGIGQAIAESLARAGARTILASRSLPKLAAIARNLRGEGFQAEAMELDISSRDSRERFCGELPGVDILVNVAGTNIRRNFIDYTPEEYGFLMQTNLTGIVELTQAVGRQMIERGQGGKVVTIGSLSCLMGMPGGRVGQVQHSSQLHRPGLYPHRSEQRDVGAARDARLAEGDRSEPEPWLTRGRRAAGGLPLLTRLGLHHRTVDRG